jgi:hypothetical protein
MWYTTDRNYRENNNGSYYIFTYIANLERWSDGVMGKAEKSPPILQHSNTPKKCYYE